MTTADIAPTLYVRPEPAVGYELRHGRIVSLTSGLGYSIDRATSLLQMIVEEATVAGDAYEAERFMRNATRLVQTIRLARKSVLN